MFRTLKFFYQHSLVKTCEHYHKACKMLSGKHLSLSLLQLFTHVCDLLDKTAGSGARVKGFWRTETSNWVPAKRRGNTRSFKSRRGGDRWWLFFEVACSRVSAAAHSKSAWTPPAGVLHSLQGNYFLSLALQQEQTWSNTSATRRRRRRRSPCSFFFGGGGGVGVVGSA